MKPAWLKVRLPTGDSWREVDRILSEKGLHTVCDEARCPNKGECWGCGTATFMILGDLCTRGCRFCAVKTSKQGIPPRADEPEALAQAVAELGLSYVVITSVDRDDLADRGAGHFAACIAAVRAKNPGTRVEVLVPDYYGEEMRLLENALPDVLSHNVETVRRLQGIRDARASFDKSLSTLREAKDIGVPVTKSSILLGLGETEEELYSCWEELRKAGVDILVMGQYLRPSPAQIPVQKYIEPAAFEALRQKALSAGFSTVVSSPFARTSYKALEAWASEER
ncbi:MAG TPA: lipoyl synthase [Rectinemataceae bacterium]